MVSQRGVWLASTLALSGLAGAADQGLYRCQDAQGRVAYSDRPCAAQAFIDSHGRTDAKPEAGPPLGNITRKQLEQLLSAYDSAARRFDVESMLPLLADELKVEVVARTPEGMARRVMRKAEFVERLRARAGDVSDYAAHRENLQFSITPNGAQAEVSSTLVQSWREHGLPQSLVSDDQYLVEVRDGRLRFIAIHAMAHNRPHSP